MVANMPSGIHIPAGATLTITSSQNYNSGCSGAELNLEYAVSGYYAQS